MDETLQLAIHRLWWEKSRSKGLGEQAVKDVERQQRDKLRQQAEALRGK